ncbi:unnamed protein product [Caenorhabditis angaria]|uniref:protein-tyrosine-phosphatase n=1 Tax=Caenorhabditis angaria TaxID=860376 RepID=A0A9P1IFW2_9PELO|nr:unnamed protein product [Caenorhabditis angaria]
MRIKNYTWIWWITVILLYLRSTVEAFDEEISLSNENESKPEIEEKPGPKSALSLGLPRCETNYDCSHDGVCKKGADGYGVCLCAAACPATIPSRCGRLVYAKSNHKCLVMDEDYRSRYDVPSPTCHNARCMCPPQFSDVQLSSSTFPLFLNTTLPPFRCDKRDLQVQIRVHPSESVFLGTDVKMYCCINVDPEHFVDATNVRFVQNTTRIREPTGHPFREEYRRHSSDNTYACWELELKNAQQSDTGSYMCMVTTSLKNKTANHTINFEVKAPTTITNVSYEATDKSVVVTWEFDKKGNEIPIRLRLMRRSDVQNSQVINNDNATSPTVINGLQAATPYTLFISGQDGMEPFERTVHFTTKEKKPHAPRAIDVRVLNSGSNLMCEVEWKAPGATFGRLTKYFVSVRGSIRTIGPNGELTPFDFPLASIGDKKCANWDQDEAKAGVSGINPVDFSADFFSCKFGPLKPNRNYTVNVWAENQAGRSTAANFTKTCVTNYAQPDVVHEPTTSLSSNQSTFSLSFGNRPDDSNGPISCYYVAVVPLPKNVSLDLLPPTNEIVMDSVTKVFQNNMDSSSAEMKRYFAYVAESYKDWPAETVIGDGNGVEGVEPCNVHYLSRHSAEDLALLSGLKYTGFLIVRVDKEEDKMNDRSFRIPPRKLRQLHLSGPAYGYSGYFKPIILELESESSGLTTALKIFIPIFLFLAMAVAIAMFIIHRRGDDMEWCLFSKILSKDVGDRKLLRQSFGAVPVEDLPTEYVMRHRDSDFVFNQEFDSLPHYQLETTASNRYPHKNRYNDIRAFDDSRVKLQHIHGDDSSDYINANFIKSWNSKKTFIATQAPVDLTLGDFWRMVWEQQSYLIVMVANLTEKNRPQCTKYWPDDSPQRYGDIIVQHVESSYYSDYNIRVFDIIHIDECSHDPSVVEYANVPLARNSVITGGNSRRIYHYHFINWNDYKAPECSIGILRFLHILRELDEFNESPVVIHCSAGVGRTGTFITIDSMFDQCKTEGKANVFEFVSFLRKQRNLMVQSLEQYVFIYKALAEWYMYGYTDLDAKDFEQHYHLLREPMRDRSASFNNFQKVVVKTSEKTNNANGLEEEFKKLERNLGGTLSSNFAASDANLLKNRYESAVPYDKYRVVLSQMIGLADSTYINASHIKGYFYPYIVAQDPVSEMTVFDFWRMISDMKIRTVVMLSNEDEWSEPEKYWPEEEGKSARYTAGKYHVDVEFVREEEFPDFYQRTLTFGMKDQEMSQNQEIVQFAFTSWPSSQIVPSSSAALLTLISRVLERQSKLQDPGPILVHCRNGSSETGIFVCISLLLLRLRAEHRIDVFQTVKGLQNQRPQMFTKLEQYAFCYKAVADYISKPSSR